MNFSLSVLQNTRKALIRILENTSLEKLNKIPEGFNNNIIWNIGHIIVTEQILAYKLSGQPVNISNELIQKYIKGSKPIADVTQEEVNEINELLKISINKTIEDYDNGLFKDFNEYTVSTTGNTLTNIEESLEFILFHEGIHLGIVMAMLKIV